MGFRFNVLFFVCSMFAASASAHRSPHVRTLDPHIREVIDDGVSRSTLFRDLVAQLDASDVIVYAEADCLMPSHLQGRMTFMSAAGGQRYVKVAIACMLGRPRQIAILAHELQHATEVAAAACVVDARSLEREYQRIGFPSSTMSRSASYESRAAIDAAQRVLKEVASSGE